MSEDPEEEAAADRRINTMVALVEQLGKDNGSGREYLTALTVAAGRYLRGMPDPTMRAKTVNQFLQAVHRFAQIGVHHDG
jgi:hypothetical protein